jgi:hypothetical protein
MNKGPVRVAYADDHTLKRESVTSVLIFVMVAHMGAELCLFYTIFVLTLSRTILIFLFQATRLLSLISYRNQVFNDKEVPSFR